MAATKVMRHKGKRRQGKRVVIKDGGTTTVRKTATIGGKRGRKRNILAELTKKSDGSRTVRKDVVITARRGKRKRILVERHRGADGLKRLNRTITVTGSRGRERTVTIERVVAADKSKSISKTVSLSSSRGVRKKSVNMKVDASGAGTRTVTRTDRAGDAQTRVFSRSGRGKAWAVQDQKQGKAAK